MAPIVDGLAGTYAGKVSVRKINANTDPSVTDLGVQGVPTYIFINKDGKEISRIVGADPQSLKQGFDKAGQ